MDGMQPSFRFDGPEGGGDALGEDLAAEDMRMIGIVESAIQVLLDLLHVEQTQDLGQYGIQERFSRASPALMAGRRMIPAGRLRENRCRRRHVSLVCPRVPAPDLHAHDRATLGETRARRVEDAPGA
ncbi:MAG: hypothetical protein U5R48_01105 [Gammaproteobacteria bacterium]|nr:hypothetical protein [Gammaproteobacteria bacterium]